MAKELGVSGNNILAMKHNGFRMPGGKASLRMAHRSLLFTHAAVCIPKLPVFSHCQSDWTLIH